MCPPSILCHLPQPRSHCRDTVGSMNETVANWSFVHISSSQTQAVSGRQEAEAREQHRLGHWVSDHSYHTWFAFQAYAWVIKVQQSPRGIKHQVFFSLPSKLPQSHTCTPKIVSVIMVPSGVPITNCHLMSPEAKPRKVGTWVTMWINLSKKTGKMRFQWQSKPKQGRLETSGFSWGQLGPWDSLGRNFHVAFWKVWALLKCDCWRRQRLQLENKYIHNL